MRASVWKMAVLILAVAVTVSGQTQSTSGSRTMPFGPTGDRIEIQNAAADDPVTTTRDERGVWFIEGGSLYDVFEAQGYAVATDRLERTPLWRGDIALPVLLVAVVLFLYRKKIFLRV